MAANRGIATGGTVTGTEHAVDANDEFAALWDKALTKLGSVAGTNTITAAATPALTAYADGQSFAFIPAVNNSGAVTINIDSNGAKDIKNSDGTALATGDLLTTTLYAVMYDGTAFRLLHTPPSVTAEVEIAILRHHQTDATDGGTATSGATQVYPLTEIVVSGITGLLLATNTVTVPVGKYLVTAAVQFRNCNTGKLKLYDATGAAYFTSAFVGPQVDSGAESTTATLVAIIDLATVTDVELHYDVETTQATSGLGLAHAGLTDDEEYGSIMFQRISAWTSAKTSVSQLGVNVGSDATRKFNARSDEIGFEAIPAADSGTGNLISHFDTENDGGFKIVTYEEDLTLSSGTDVLGATVMPAGVKIIGGSWRVTTEITGAAAWNFGTADSKTLFGSSLALTAGTTGALSTENITSGTVEPNIQSTAGDFTAGVVRISVTYIEMKIPTA